jgi:hypothetical protein
MVFAWRGTVLRTASRQPSNTNISIELETASTSLDQKHEALAPVEGSGFCTMVGGRHHLSLQTCNLIEML